MTKLLDKPFKAFTIYAMVILLVSIPIYFLVVDWIWVTEIDEHHVIIKERIENRFAEASTTEAEYELILATWNLLQPGSTIKELENDFIITRDSIYEITKYNEYEGESDRFRGLQTVIRVNGKPYLLNVETNVEESYETIFAIGLVTLLLYGLLVFGFIRLNKTISEKIWKPFDNTLTKLKTFDLSKTQGVKFEESDIEEFEELNQSISYLIAQNISVYNQQKAFVANASHELQTPIALLKSKLDLLFQQENLSQEHSELIQALQIPLARLTRVNKNLLLLAKIENSQFGDGEKVNFQVVLDRSIDLLQDYIDERDLLVTKEIVLYELVSCSKFLAETLVNNLLSNAIRHTIMGGEIAVSLSERTLIFKNTGKEKLDEESLFKRFSISTTETTNSGLGLAIVKEICKQNGWSINYNFSDSAHIFSVRF